MFEHLGGGDDERGDELFLRSGPWGQYGGHLDQCGRWFAPFVVAHRRNSGSGRVDGGVEGKDVARSDRCGEVVDSGLQRLELFGRLYGDRTEVVEVDDDLVVGQVAAGRVIGRRDRCGGGDGNGGGDAHGEGDGAEGCSRARLVAREVADGQPHRDRCAPAGGSKGADGKGGDEQDPEGGRDDADDDEQRPPLMGEREEADAGGEEDAAQYSEPMRGLGSRWSSRQRRDDGNP